MNRSLYTADIFSSEANDLFNRTASITQTRGLYRMLKFYHKQTAWHSVGVARIASGLVTSTDLSDIVEDKEDFVRDALLHDIGKLTVGINILDKPGKLNDDEMNIIKRHPWVGYFIVKSFEEDSRTNPYYGLRILLSHYFQKDSYPIRNEAFERYDNSIDDIFERFNLDTNILCDNQFMLSALSLAICDHFDARYPVKKDIVNSHDYNYRTYSVEALPLLIEASFTESLANHNLSLMDKQKSKLIPEVLNIINYIGKKALEASEITNYPINKQSTPFDY